jgi:CheY-like chemotaxis protein/anti-sigma regulatory factor (Ser/Thr protein kinase)
MKTETRDQRLVGKRILVVDDTPANIELLAAILEPHGFNVLVATSGDTALRVAHRTPPDLVLLDVMMPGLDGFETCRLMKAEPALADIPIIFVTARDDPEDVVMGLRQGAVDYVTKPVRHEEVLMRVRAHVLLKVLNDALQAKAAEAESLLHILCHDLQNSVGAARGYIGLVEGAPADDSRSFLMECRVSLDRTIEIIDHVRELRALATGKRSLRLSPLRLGDGFDAIMGLFRLKLAEKDIELAMPEGAALDIAVNVDAVPFVNCVLNNLVSNAIKFSHRGSRIALEAEVKGREVHLAVRDPGIGMSETLLADLFHTERPTSREGTAGELGTGFGMPLVKQYMDLFGGRIVVESVEQVDGVRNHGTTVHLYLARASEDPSRALRDAMSSPA